MSRRFVLIRLEDETGISGTGCVADGTQFRNLKCVLCWRTAYSSVAVYDDVETLMKIHGHNGKTVLEWVDPEVQEYYNTVNPKIRGNNEGS